MTLTKHARRAYQIKYIRVYFAARNPDNTYDNFQDVTRYVTGTNMGQYRRSIDSNDFDIGFYEESNMTVSFDNRSAKFMADRGFFEGKIVDRSKIRIDAGYHDAEDPSIADFETTFEGIINDEGTRLDTTNEDAVFTILSYSSIIQNLRADPGAVTNGQTFKTAFYNLLNRSEVTGLLTLDLDNIDPKVNETIEDYSWFTGKQLNTAINSLLLASNSIMKIRDNTIYIAGRTESSTVRFQFWGKGASRPANIEKIQNYNNGLRRVITRASVNGTIVDAADEIIDLYGAHLKTVDIGFITDPDTETAIGEDIIDEFQYPKPELELTTDFIGNEIELLDLVTIDNEGHILDSPPALYGRAVYGANNYCRREGGVRIRMLEGWKVLAITHDFNNYSTTLKLRSIGNRPYDSSAGYNNPIYGQATYGLSLYATV